jgi:hypothetical protein
MRSYLRDDAQKGKSEKPLSVDCGIFSESVLGICCSFVSNRVWFGLAKDK